MIKNSYLYILSASFIFVLNFALTYKSFHKQGMQKIIGSDAQGYFEYLPYFIIKKDIAHQGYAYPLENGNTINKYTMGVAILQSPFYIAAYAIDLCSARSFESNIISPIYGNAIAIATSFYLSLAFLFLFQFLRKSFSSSLTALITSILIYFGTNLYYYSHVEPGMSHSYSFFGFSAFVFFTQKFYENPLFKRVIIPGLLLGILTLIRPTNITLALFFILYHVYTLKELKSRMVYLFKAPYIFGAFLVLGVIAYIPQMLYWKKVTGKYFVFSYGYNNESFIYWKSPKLFLTLFGTHCGWLLFTPVMLLFLIGLIGLLRNKQQHGPGICAVFLSIFYINASWWAYNFSCGFGYRAFVEYYPIFAIPIAYLIHLSLQGMNKRTPVRIVIFCSIIATFIYFNITLTNKYESWWWCSDQFKWKDYCTVLSRIF